MLNSGRSSRSSIDDACVAQVPLGEKAKEEEEEGRLPEPTMHRVDSKQIRIDLLGANGPSNELLSSKGNRPDSYLLGMNLNHFSPASQLLLCSAAIFTFFLIYGYLQVLSPFPLPSSPVLITDNLELC